MPFACEKTQAFAAKTKITEAVVTWFIEGNADDYTDIAIGAENSAEAVSTYAAPLIANGILKADVPGDTIAVKTFWILCNDQYKIDRNRTRPREQLRMKKR